ncbi:DNA methylase, partial [human gut metagenome]
AEEASYKEYKDNLRRNAQNFRITDEHLGEGGPKAKFQANVNAIRLLKELESAGQQASPEQQEVLSPYVGWGGIPDAFDPEKPAWASEYTQLKELLTPEEYAAARSSTLNAHYTSPTVIQAIYEAVGAWALRPEIFWSHLWVWAISSVCCRRKCETAVYTVWNWTRFPGAS